MDTLQHRDIVPIFSGGGTRLACYVGILRGMQELDVGYRHLVGVSGGGIVASLAAAGWSYERMRELVLNTDFSQFQGFSPLTLLRTGGLSSGDRFEDWMDARLEGRRFRDVDAHLHIVATDINGGGPVIFDRHHTPDMPISRAVRYSMSIPLLFSFKSFNGQIMTDGVILSEDTLRRDWSGNQTPVVCFRLRSEESQRRSVQPNRWVPLATYLHLLVQTFMNAVSREYVRTDHWHSTLIINTRDVSPIDFHLSVQTKEQLLDWGYRTTLEFLPTKLTRMAETPAPVRPALN